MWVRMTTVVVCCAAAGAVYSIADESSPREDGLFRLQYHVAASTLCNAGACLDIDGDGRREFLYGARTTDTLNMLDAATGKVTWSKPVKGEQHHLFALDINQDGTFELLSTVGKPGLLYVLDPSGAILNTWDSGDWKIGNSPVVIDTDRDGVLEGYFGTRDKYLVQFDLRGFQSLKRRHSWSQCGCNTSAMDVDHDGVWDLFAGSGDDQAGGKGVLHRYRPASLETVWSYKSDDNASSADPVLADIDGDGEVEVIKSVDNYGHDEPHDAVYAFKTDGTLMWRVAGLSGEDSPNVADLDGDGSVEIVGMTFGGEVYCLDERGGFKWRKDLRPNIDDSAHTYMTPILCDLDGDRQLEILAMTTGAYFEGPPENTNGTANGILFALAADGTVLDSFDVGGPRFFMEAFVTNLDDDPYLEVVLAGSGGVDVVQTRGFGANVEYFQRRRTYQRLNVLGWAYDDSYFIHRGTRVGVTNLTDNLVLQETKDGYLMAGRFVTELLTLPPGCYFDRLQFQVRTPPGTSVSTNLLDTDGTVVRGDVRNGATLDIAAPVRIEFLLSTTDRSVTPILDEYQLSFDRRGEF